MSDLNVIVLSPAEKPIVWLNSDTLNITYTEEIGRASCRERV